MGDVYGRGGIMLELSGKTFLLEDPQDHGYLVFLGILSEGASGLSLSRTHPDKLRLRYGITCPMFWLSQVERKECIDPTSLAVLCHTIIEFMKTNKRPAVILEVLEYLVTQTDFITVLKHLHIINDYVKMLGAVFILPLCSAAFHSRELSLLEREFGNLERIK